MENEGHGVKSPWELPLGQGGHSPKILYTFFSSPLSQRWFSIVYVLNGRLAGVKPKREVDACLCGQRREGGKDFLLQNKAELLITKSSNVLTIRKCWPILCMGGFAQVLRVWGSYSNSVMPTFLDSSRWRSELSRRRRFFSLSLSLSLSFSASKK